jgi:hypothetical protein
METQQPIVEYIHQQWKSFLEMHYIPNVPNLISLDNVCQFIQTKQQNSACKN